MPYDSIRRLPKAIAWLEHLIPLLGIILYVTGGGGYLFPLERFRRFEIAKIILVVLMMGLHKLSIIFCIKRIKPR